jgi:hypothetical protein
MTKCRIKYKVAICGRTKYIINKSFIFYEQLCDYLCRNGCRKRNTHNLLTPPGLFTLSLPLSLSLSLSLPLLIAYSIEFCLTTIVQSKLCTKNEHSLP